MTQTSTTVYVSWDCSHLKNKLNDRKTIQGNSTKHPNDKQKGTKALQFLGFLKTVNLNYLSIKTLLRKPILLLSVIIKK